MSLRRPGVSTTTSTVDMVPSAVPPERPDTCELICVGLAAVLSVMNVCLKVWDLRKGSAIMDVKHHEDYISDITVDQARRTLLTARLDPEGLGS